MENEEQVRIFKAMTPEQKLTAALRLYYSARELKAASLRAFHPHFSEEQIQSQVRDYFLYANT